MKKTMKGLLIVLAAIVISVPLIAAPASALDFGLNYGDSVGLSSKDPREIVGNIIQIALSLLGIIAVFIILLGGFKWMTAAGSEEQVSEAKKIIGAGIIGLIIIFAAWGIARFVIDQLSTKTTTP